MPWNLAIPDLGTYYLPRIFLIAGNMAGKTRKYHIDDRSPDKRTGGNRIVFAVALLVVIIAIIAIAAIGILKTGDNIPGSALNGGCETLPDPNATSGIPPDTFPVTDITLAPPVATDDQIPDSILGKLNVSVGNFPGNLPVFVDGIFRGSVSFGNPLSLNMSEGTHAIKVCSGTVCEEANVHIGRAIMTSLNFEKLLSRDIPLGFLNISIGDYPATIPVFIDEEKVGQAVPGKLLNVTLPAGIHSIAVCAEGSCINNSIIISPMNQTVLNYTDRLKQDLPKGDLVVSIGGFNAELPVFIDNISAGTASVGNPLTLKLNRGNHSVAVCAGKVCENETVQIRFAKQSFVDFGERLKEDVEFTVPTVRITSSFLSGSTLMVGVDLINPDSKTHVISATISCVYSYSDSHNMRHSDSAQNRISATVKPGENVTQNIQLSLPGGSNVIANDPVVMDVTVS
jgi:hypothetical protein